MFLKRGLERFQKKLGSNLQPSQFRASRGSASERSKKSAVLDLAWTSKSGDLRASNSGVVRF